MAERAVGGGQRRRDGGARLPAPGGRHRRAARRARRRTAPSSRAWCAPPRGSSSPCPPSTTCAARARARDLDGGLLRTSSPNAGAGRRPTCCRSSSPCPTGSDRLTEDEVISTAILLFAAGFETTTNLIGNGLLALLRHPDQLGALRAVGGDPAAVQRAVEELLRWDSPVQLDGRDRGPRRWRWRDRPSRPATNVMTLLGAANRDPRRFHDPECLDLARDEGPPMSFGSGIHYCLGAALARLEGQVCFCRLLDALRRGGARRS